MRKVYHKIIKISGNVITVEAEGAAYNELAEVSSARGVSLAQVIRLDGNQVSLQVFAGARGISTGDQIRFLGREMTVSGSDALLGRVFNGRGVPRDNRPEINDEPTAIGTPSVNPAKRIIPRNMIRTNIPMIDVFNTLVESQKLPIFSVAGEPYNELLARIALQAEVDVIILGGMGLKYDDYLIFKRTLDEHGALNRTVMFIHTAADPVVECLMVPDMSLAVAESYALKGKRVLVLLTDMTNFADALKEIAVTMEQIPATRGYPGDLYSQLAGRYEKAVDFDSAGSITILAVTTMPGDDVTHPVPDNTGYITEGQLFLRRDSDIGKVVVDPFRSLSRLKQLVSGKKTRKDHPQVMNAAVRLYADAANAKTKLENGFDLTNYDERTLSFAKEYSDKLLAIDVNLNTTEMLDVTWGLFSKYFKPEEVNIRQELIDTYWKQ